MIKVTRFNDSTFWINADLIETIEDTPDTVITLTTGRKFIVKEDAENIRNLVLSYKKGIFSGLL